MLFLKPHQPQSLLRTPLYLFLWQSEILWPETDIGKDIHLKQLMLRILKNKADLAAQRAQIIAFLVNILSIIIDGTATFPSTVRSDAGSASTLPDPV